MFIDLIWLIDMCISPSDSTTSHRSSIWRQWYKNYNWKMRTAPIHQTKKVNEHFHCPLCFRYNEKFTLSQWKKSWENYNRNCGIIRHQLPNGEILKTSAQNWPPYPLQIMDKTPIGAYAFSISKPHRQCHFTLALWPWSFDSKSLEIGQTHKLIERIPTTNCSYLFFCEGCVYGKQSC